MFRSPCRAVDEIDSIMVRALLSENPDLLDELAPHMPKEQTVYLREVCAAPRADVDALIRVARGTAMQGRRATADAAYAMALNAMETAGSQAALLREVIQWRRGDGQTDRAQQDERALARLDNAPPPPGRPMELESAEYAIVCAAASPADFAEYAAAPSPLDQDPLRDPAWMKRDYLRYVCPKNGRADDLSFFVLDSDGPCLQVECDVIGLMPLGCRNTGIVVTPLKGTAPAEAVDLAMRQLTLNAVWAGSPLFYYDKMDDSPIDPPERIEDFLHRGNIDERIACADIDLAPPSETILRGFRETHRQQAVWGLKSLTIRSDRDLGAAIITDYLGVYERAGRGISASAETLAAGLAARRYGLYVSYLDGLAVGAVCVSRHGSTVYYAASSRADCGSKPVTHALLYQAICDAKESGMTRFDFGLLHIDTRFSAKLQNIAKYKLGFGGTLRPGTRRLYSV